MYIVTETVEHCRVVVDVSRSSTEMSVCVQDEECTSPAQGVELCRRDIRYTSDCFVILKTLEAD
jgi:hypothetical protein